MNIIQLYTFAGIYKRIESVKASSMEKKSSWVLDKIKHNLICQNNASKKQGSIILRYINIYAYM